MAKCTLCLKSFKTKRGLSMHNRMVHTNFEQNENTPAPVIPLTNKDKWTMMHPNTQDTPAPAIPPSKEDKSLPQPDIVKQSPIKDPPSPININFSEELESIKQFMTTLVNSFATSMTSELSLIKSKIEENESTVNSLISDILENSKPSSNTHLFSENSPIPTAVETPFVPVRKGHKTSQLQNRDSIQLTNRFEVLASEDKPDTIQSVNTTTIAPGHHSYSETVKNQPVKQQAHSTAKASYHQLQSHQSYHQPQLHQLQPKQLHPQQADYQTQQKQQIFQQRQPQQNQQQNNQQIQQNYHQQQPQRSDPQHKLVLTGDRNIQGVQPQEVSYHQLQSHQSYHQPLHETQPKQLHPQQVNRQPQQNQQNFQQRQPQQNQQLNNQQIQQQNHHQPQPQRSNSQHKLLLVGDSNIHGVQPRELARKIRKNVFVVRQAISGATASHICHYSEILLKDKPDSIIIHAGTNDVHGRNSENLSAESVACELIRTGVKARNAGVQNIMISALLPINDIKANEKALEINSHLRDHCKAYNFVYVDNSNMTTGDLYDAVHLTREGRVVLVDNFAFYMNKY